MSDAPILNVTLFGDAPLRIRLNAPYSDEAISKYFYDDDKVKIVHDKKDALIVYLDYDSLRDEYKNDPKYTSGSLRSSELGRIILISGMEAAKFGDQAQFLRTFYQNGIEQIDKMARMRLVKMPTAAATSYSK